MDEHASTAHFPSFPQPVAMGVAGLLKMISSCVHEVELSAYRGRKIAVDASCWLHRGTFACPIELAAGEALLTCTYAHRPPA